jgi:hypothetical protein
MAAILLENVRDSIHSALKERAEANNRSLDALACLEIVLRPENLSETQRRSCAHYAFE